MEKELLNLKKNGFVSNIEKKLFDIYILDVVKLISINH